MGAPRAACGCWHGTASSGMELGAGWLLDGWHACCHQYMPAPVELLGWAGSVAIGARQNPQHASNVVLHLVIKRACAHIYHGLQACIGVERGRLGCEVGVAPTCARACVCVEPVEARGHQAQQPGAPHKLHVDGTIQTVRLGGGRQVRQCSPHVCWWSLGARWDTPACIAYRHGGCHHGGNLGG